MSRMHRALLLSLACVLAVAVPLAGAKGGPPSADEQAIRAANASWAQFAAARNLEGTLSFYADDAVLLWPDAPPAAGKQAVRAAWIELFKDPAYSLSWRIEELVVSRSGDLAYARGSYDSTYTAAGHAVREHGKFLVIWKKQANGVWRVALDTDNADAPAKPIKP